MNAEQRLAHYTAKIASEKKRPTFNGPRQAERMRVLRYKRRRMKHVLSRANA